MEQLTRQKLIALVDRIMKADGTEDEINNMISLLRASVRHPEVSNLIFYPDREMTAEEIVDVALSYKPIQL